MRMAPQLGAALVRVALLDWPLHSVPFPTNLRPFAGKPSARLPQVSLSRGLDKAVKARLDT